MEREGQASQRIADGCTLHGGEPFTAICRQCGTYMCKQCSEHGRFEQCARCRAIPVEQVAASERAGTAFPFRRDGVAWGTFLRFCFERYSQNFGLLTLTMIVCFGALFVVNMLGSLLLFAVSTLADGGFFWVALSLVQVLVLSVLILGVLKISLRVAQNQPADLSLLWTGLPRVGAFLLLSAAMGTALLGVSLLLLAVFGLGFSSLDANDWTLGTLLLGGLLAITAMGLSIYVALGLVFACLEIVAQPELTVLRALKNAWHIARGERLTVGFGLFLINLLLWAGLLMCGIGLLFTLGYAMVMFAALYLALRNGAPLPVSTAPAEPKASR